MRISALALVVMTGVSLSTGCASDDRFRVNATEADRVAGDALARRMLHHLGGERFQQLSTIRWTFVIRAAGFTVTERQHVWDPRRGLAYVVLDEEPRTEVWLRLADKSGVAKRAGVELRGEQARALIDKAYAYWVNDAFWLAAPFKVFDPGVTRERVQGGVRVRFEEVGLTPGDRYIYELDEDGRLTGWTYHLQSGLERHHDFTDPVTLEGVTFFQDKGGVELDDLSATTQPDDEAFGPLESVDGP